MLGMSATVNGSAARINAKISKAVLRQIPYAASRSLNDTGEQILKMNKIHMKRVFDKPVRYTLNAFYMERSKRNKLQMTVRRKSKPSGKHYLDIQAKGGPRPKKGVEKMAGFKVPYKNDLRAITPTSHVRDTGSAFMAEFLKAMPGIKATQPTAPYTKNRYQKSQDKPGKRTTYFIGYKKDVGGRASSDGIYKRTPRGVKKMFHLLNAHPTYEKRFMFHDTAMRNAVAYMPSRYRKRLREALRQIKL